MAKNHYRSGDWNVICDVCAIKVKASDTKERWDGFRVCPSCFEHRQPQDFVRARQDKISIPFARPILPTPFSIPVGWQDIVSVKDGGWIAIVAAVLNINETVLVADYKPAINLALLPHEYINVTETYKTESQQAKDIRDLIFVEETGAICSIDYVEPDYFAEIYVGTCFIFPASNIREQLKVKERGFIEGDPYVEFSAEMYFESDYVGTITYFY
jgi:hypothetical protein